VDVDLNVHTNLSDSDSLTGEALRGWVKVSNIWAEQPAMDRLHVWVNIPVTVTGKLVLVVFTRMMALRMLLWYRFHNVNCY
jgi:hypothetical protein